MDELMKENLKNTAVKYAEKYAQLSLDFVFEIVNTASKTSKNLVDDAVVSVINPIKPTLSNIMDNIYKGEN